LNYIDYEIYYIGVIFIDNNSRNTRHFYCVSIQTQVIHVYIIVVGAVLLAVNQFQDHKLAGNPLLELNTPLCIARC
jgi:hypothetical protein